MGGGGREDDGGGEGSSGLRVRGVRNWGFRVN